MDFKKNIHYSQDVEEAVLGSCLLEGMALGRTYGLIDADSFYFDSHKEIYSAMREMYDESVPVDVLTVTDSLINKRGKEEFYGLDTGFFLTRLTNHVVSTAHLEYHCHIVKEMWRKREVIKLRHKVVEGESRDMIYDLDAELKKILGADVKKDWHDMEEVMYGLLVHQSDVVSGKKQFVTTGFNQIDRLNGGFYNGQMIVIGARPSVGKSALMGQMALAMAKTGKKVGIISLEMNNNEIAARLSSIETEIPFQRIYRDIANDESLHKKFYQKVSAEMINLPIFLSDKTGVNVNEIKAKATKLKASKGCDCLMIDYLQLVEGGSSNKQYNREQEVAKMSRGIKLMAQELDIPIIVLCQLNRGVTSRGQNDRYPRLSDLRESGAIEQDADVVMMLHRDYMSGILDDGEGGSTEFLADLLGQKWRNGATFHLTLDFDPPKMKFSEQSQFRKYTPEENNFQDDNPF
jgi:replicative DNA helicase